jgi:hypothetical protein
MQPDWHVAKRKDLIKAGMTTRIECRRPDIESKDSRESL